MFMDRLKLGSFTSHEKCKQAHVISWPHLKFQSNFSSELTKKTSRNFEHPTDWETTLNMENAKK